jgi:uncharacterized protein with beta-barrel porin domain
MDTDGYRENGDGFVLNVNSHTENLHFLRAGADITYMNRVASFNWYATGKFFYSDLYGDTTTETGSYFTAGPMNCFMSVGAKLDENSLGLGADVGISLNQYIDVALDYTFLTGNKVHTHQAGDWLKFKILKNLIRK